MIAAWTGAQVRAAETPFLERGEGPALMRRAAHGLALVGAQRLRGRRGRVAGARVVVLAGTGNNGGDGLWAGAELAGRGASVLAVAVGDRLHPEGGAALEAAGGRVLRAGDGGPALEEAAEHVLRADLVLDAVLGTGARGGLRGPAAELVRAVLDRWPPDGGPAVVACDVPSGVSADTGAVAGPVLAADATVTFGGAKAGLFLPPGDRWCGEVRTVPLGIEHALPAPALRRLEPDDVAALWPRPGAASHKYSRGVVGVVAGSPTYPGAALMCTRAAVDAGAGMVRHLGDAATRSLVCLTSPEVVASEDHPDDVHVQAWVVGPGAVGDAAQESRIGAVLAGPIPAVVDAGALDAAARAAADGVLGPGKVLTPHAGELEQVLAWLAALGGGGQAPDRAAIEAEPARWARAAAEATGAVVVLKGATTVVASPDGTLLSQADGSPWLATAGSGDTLAGIMGAALAGSAEDPDAFAAAGDWARGDARRAVAAALAVAVHGYASRLEGLGPVPPTALSANVRTVLRRDR
ncbi:NAD(P)H-hydrate epimerase [Kocuria rosea]|uniref:Bifunctional NAD(P)H-hydrate repair enzyme n=1 Tax=Kocuria rosea TaxID=1275 RepID=A0A4V3B440_KOCRO|nr:NAD(P)H-hydrate epimerase [Kocuria rosea]TDL47183.1 NAD(P)H-hydrate epimerase [Kocuria rosea]